MRLMTMSVTCVSWFGVIEPLPKGKPSTPASTKYCRGISIVSCEGGSASTEDVLYFLSVLAFGRAVLSLTRSPGPTSGLANTPIPIMSMSSSQKPSIASAPTASVIAVSICFFCAFLTLCQWNNPALASASPILPHSVGMLSCSPFLRHSSFVSTKTCCGSALSPITPVSAHTDNTRSRRGKRYEVTI